MPSVTIPLVGNPNPRGSYVSTLGTKDQLFTNCVPVLYKNSVTGSGNIYLQKRFGTTTTTPAGSATITANFYSEFQSLIYEASSQTVYKQSTSIGTLTSGKTVQYINSTLIGGKEYVCFVVYDSFGLNSEGWYHVSDATVTSFTGDRTSGSAVVNNIASTTGLYAGQLVSGTGFAAGTRILTVDSATQVTLNANASSGAPTSTVFTVEPLAKILDSDFPASAQGNFAFLDGYAFIHDWDGKVWNSDLNSVTSWSASSYISTNTGTDPGKGVYAYRNYIFAFGKKTIEVFQNAGNPFGSPLQRVNGLTFRVGLASLGDSSTNRTPVSAKIVNEEIYFSGASPEGVSAYKISGTGISKISNTHIDKLLTASSSKMSSVFAFGQIGVCFFYDGTDAIVYWPDSDIWTYWTGPTDGGSDRGYWHICCFDSANVRNILGGLLGKRFTTVWAGSPWTDDSAAYSMIVRTTKTDFGTNNRKTVNCVSLIGADKQSSGTATLEYSDDDYATWTTAGTFDLTKTNPRIYRCGSFQGGRAWRLSHSSNTDFRAQSLKFDYEEGAH